MIRYASQYVVMLAGLFVLVATTLLPLQPVFGEGGARRDVVLHEKQNLTDAINLAQEAVGHGKQGHGGALLTSAEAALQHAHKAGKDSHVGAGVAELKNAIKHGQAGHADVAMKHAEQAVLHLSKAK